MTHLFTQARHNAHMAHWAETLNQYNFDVIHIGGIENVFADLLSRTFPEIWGLPLRADLRPNSALNMFMNMDDLSFRIQESGSPGLALMKRLADEQLEEEYEEALYLVGTSPLVTVKPSKVTDEQLEKIKYFHGMGHFGSRHTINQMRHCGENWAHLDEHVRQVTESCTVCQHWTLGTRKFHPRQRISSAMPWDHIQFDLITSFPEDVNGFQYILVVVDVFTGFVILKKLRTRKAKPLLEALWKIFTLFGIPKLIQSDNEAAFTSVAAKQFIKVLESRMGGTTPYNHRSLGIAESYVKIVSALVRKIIEEHGGIWSEHLELAVLQINSRICEKKGASPFELMYNSSPNVFVKFQQMMEKEYDKSDDPKDLADWKWHQNMILSELFHSIKNRVEALKEREAAAFTKKGGRNILPFNSIPIGTPVMIWDQHRQDKNEAPYVGPYVIAEGSADGKYKVADPVNGAVYHRNVTLDQMKVCRLAVLPSDKEDLDEYYLDFVIDHRRNKDTQRHEYLVRFAGFNDADDMWLPAENIEPVAIKDYNQTVSRLSKTNQAVRDRLIQESIESGKHVGNFEDWDPDVIPIAPIVPVVPVPVLPVAPIVPVVEALRGDELIVPGPAKKPKPNAPVKVSRTAPVVVPVLVDDSRGELKRKRVMTTAGVEALLQKRK